MNFSWSQEQDELYSCVLSEAQKAFPTPSDQFWTRAQWQQCADMKLSALSVPQRYGGKGYDALTTARAIEAFGRGSQDMGLVFSLAAHLFACTMPIVEHGDEALKSRFLPGLGDGTLIGANAITETQAGSDVFALKTRATRDGDAYVLNGHKSYVSNAPVADLFVVYAVTNPAHGYLGITGFVVEKGTPGLVVGEPFRKMGLTSTPGSQVFFESCRVSLANRLGREGQGAQIFKQSMLWERSCLFAAYVGQMERQLEQTIAYVGERRQFGKALGKHQAVAHRVAAMKLRLEAARLLLYRACWSFEQGEQALLDIALSKLAVSEAAVMGGLDAIHIHGSVGFNSDNGIETMLRDAIPATIFSGTSEMQYDIIASELGL
ncbi:MAG TPA: acyl-CoA dehydrogenase family protein [Ktedonobacteraceae bacterium]|nr:acyl-CoA dehydrogenase family protein [Ktedonobacteraceae bacterium]